MPITLIADSCELNRRFLRLALEHAVPVAAHDVIEVSSPTALYANLEQHPDAVVVCDPCVYDGPVATLLQELRSRAADAFVLVVSGRGSVLTAAQAWGVRTAAKGTMFAMTEIEDAIGRAHARAATPNSDLNPSMSEANLDLSAFFSSSEAQQDSMPEKLSSSMDSRSQSKALCTAA